MEEGSNLSCRYLVVYCGAAGNRERAKFVRKRYFSARRTLSAVPRTARWFGNEPSILASRYQGYAEWDAIVVAAGPHVECFRLFGAPLPNDQS